jgi:hypothetical protein
VNYIFACETKMMSVCNNHYWVLLYVLGWLVNLFHRTSLFFAVFSLKSDLACAFVLNIGPNFNISGTCMDAYTVSFNFDYIEIYECLIAHILCIFKCHFIYMD